MLMPKRTKYRRPHRVSFEGHAKGGDSIAFGQYGNDGDGKHATLAAAHAHRHAMRETRSRLWLGWVGLKRAADRPVARRHTSISGH